MNSIKYDSKSKIVVIVTGGMIMESWDEETRCYIPNKNSKEILDKEPFLECLVNKYFACETNRVL